MDGERVVSARQDGEEKRAFTDEKADVVNRGSP